MVDGITPGTGGTSLTTLNATLLRAVIAINGLQTILEKVFPQTNGTATTATGGAATLPANPVGFLTVIEPSTGVTVKIPYYGA